MISIVFLRQHLKKIIGVLIVFIIPTFVLWGVGDYFTSRRNRPYAAKIFGKKVDFQEYTVAQQTIRINTLLDLLALGLNPDQARQFINSEEMNLRGRTWDRLIQLARIRDKNIPVSDSEVQGVILANPFFYDPNTRQFNQTQYQNILIRHLEIPVSAYEDIIRENIRIIKSSSWVMDSTKTTSYESDLFKRIANEKRDISVLTYALDDFSANIVNTQDELKEFYQKHPDLFLLPPQTRISYITLTPQDVKDSITVSAKKIEDYYNDHINDYEQNETVSARHILISFQDAPNTPDAQRPREEARTKIEELLTQVRENPESFTELAQSESDGPSAVKGGDLGEFGRGMMAPAFEEAAFALQVNEISEIVETPFGFHIIQVTDRKEASQTPLENVSDIIASLLFDQSQTDALRRKASLLVDELFDSYDERLEALEFSDDETDGPVRSLNDPATTLADIAAKNNITHHQSDWFSSETEIAQPWYFDNLIAEAEELEDSEPGSMALKHFDQYYIFQIAGKRDPFIPPFEEILILADRLLTDDKARKAARAKTLQDRNLILSVLDDPDNTFASVVKNMRLTAQHPPPFPFQGPIEGFAQEDDLSKTCFTLRANELSGPLPLKKGFALVYINGIISGTDEDNTRNASSQWLSTKTNLLQKSWQDYLRDTGLHINVDF